VTAGNSSDAVRHRDNDKPESKRGRNPKGIRTACQNRRTATDKNERKRSDKLRNKFFTVLFDKTHIFPSLSFFLV
jgi:hypothetical protein